jgi:hypothetical protein
MSRHFAWRRWAWLRSRCSFLLPSLSPVGRGYSKLYASTPRHRLQQTHACALITAVVIVLVVLYSLGPPVSDPLDEKCVEFIATHNGSILGYAVHHTLIE